MRIQPKPDGRQPKVGTLSEIIGGPFDGAPALVVNNSTLALILMIGLDGGVSIRSALPAEAISKLLRDLADAYDTAARKTN